MNRGYTRIAYAILTIAAGLILTGLFMLYYILVAASVQ